MAALSEARNALDISNRDRGFEYRLKQECMSVSFCVCDSKFHRMTKSHYLRLVSNLINPHL
jgi:hypothetical protein